MIYIDFGIFIMYLYKAVFIKTFLCVYCWRGNSTAYAYIHLSIVQEFFLWFYKNPCFVSCGTSGYVGKRVLCVLSENEKS